MVLTPSPRQVVRMLNHSKVLTLLAAAIHAQRQANPLGVASGMTRFSLSRRAVGRCRLNSGGLA